MIFASLFIKINSLQPKMRPNLGSDLRRSSLCPRFLQFHQLVQRKSILEYLQLFLLQIRASSPRCVSTVINGLVLAGSWNSIAPRYLKVHHLLPMILVERNVLIVVPAAPDVAVSGSTWCWNRYLVYDRLLPFGS